MKRYILLPLVFSFSVFASDKNEVDHFRLSKSCPERTLYKLSEINRSNKTTIFKCIGEDGNAVPGYSFKIANWKSGSYLLSETKGKRIRRFQYNKNGTVNTVSEEIAGTGFKNTCKVEYKNGAISPSQDPHCKDMVKEFGSISKDISKSTFCSPNATESECVTGDGRVFRPSAKENNSVIRYLYDKNGFAVDEVETQAGESTSVEK